METSVPTLLLIDVCFIRVFYDNYICYYQKGDNALWCRTIDEDYVSGLSITYSSNPLRRAE